MRLVGVSHRAVGASAILLVGVVGGQEAAAIITSGTNGFNGSYVNDLVGANRLYNAGFTGTSSIVANIEAGLVWNGHDTLGHVTTQIVGTGANGGVDRHATWCGQTIAGRSTLGLPNLERGIAYGATLWSGAVATSWNGAAYTGSFNTTTASEMTPYRTAFLTGVNGQTADVINSSWGSGGVGQTGFTIRTVALDSLSNQTGKLIVFSAGNDGPNPNTVGDPAVGANIFSVGALHFDGAAFSTIANFSSRGPQSWYNPNTGLTVPNSKAPVDISAPGDTLTLAFYGGTTGGNTGGAASGGPDFFSFNVQGTSFAAPIVAGGAALLIDAARGMNVAPKGTDARVVKAVMMNSTDKPAGWTNNPTNPGGVWTTSQGLDWVYGAGALNLNRGFDQMFAGDRDVAGTGGGTIQPIGWDYGQVSNGSPNNYLFNSVLQAGSPFAATLNWFSNDLFNFTTLTGAAAGSLFDLNLQLLRGTPGNETLVAQSIATNGNLTEHIYFTIPTTDNYFLRVVFGGTIYNFTGDALSEEYGLAWSVPAPSSVVVLVAGIGCIGRRRRPRDA